MVSKQQDYQFSIIALINETREQKLCACTLCNNCSELAEDGNNCLLYTMGIIPLMLVFCILLR